MTVNAMTVFWMAMLTALSTGLGALPFLFHQKPSERVLGISNALAAGFMAGASALMIYEAAMQSWLLGAFGMALGVLMTYLGSRFLSDDEAHGAPVQLAGLTAKKALLIVGIMTVHSSAEGIGIGVSFGDGQELGMMIALAMMVHNIPEGLAISLVLVPNGASVGKAAWWSVFSSIPQPILAVPAFWFVSQFRAVLPVGLGFAAGAMLWMVFRELIPEARQQVEDRTMWSVALLAMVLMLLFEYFLQ